MALTRSVTVEDPQGVTQVGQELALLVIQARVGVQQLGRDPVGGPQGLLGLECSRSPGGLVALTPSEEEQGRCSSVGEKSFTSAATRWRRARRGFVASSTASPITLWVSPLRRSACRAVSPLPCSRVPMTSLYTRGGADMRFL